MNILQFLKQLPIKIELVSHIPGLSFIDILTNLGTDTEAYDLS